MTRALLLSAFLLLAGCTSSRVVEQGDAAPTAASPQELEQIVLSSLKADGIQYNLQYAYRGSELSEYPGIERRYLTELDFLSIYQVQITPSERDRLRVYRFANQAAASRAARYFGRTQPGFPLQKFVYDRDRIVVVLQGESLSAVASLTDVLGTPRNVRNYRRTESRGVDLLGRSQ